MAEDIRKQVEDSCKDFADALARVADEFARDMADIMDRTVGAIRERLSRELEGYQGG